MLQEITGECLRLLEITGECLRLLETNEIMEFTRAMTKGRMNVRSKALPVCVERHGMLYLDWWFLGDVSNEEVHCNVLAVHPLINHLSDLRMHPVAVHIAVVLEGAREGGWEG